MITHMSDLSRYSKAHSNEQVKETERNLRIIILRYKSNNRPQVDKKGIKKHSFQNGVTILVTLRALLKKTPAEQLRFLDVIQYAVSTKYKFF